VHRKQTHTHTHTHIYIYIPIVILFNNDIPLVSIILVTEQMHTFGVICKLSSAMFLHTNTESYNFSVQQTKRQIIFTE
jgi:hypothetical protein